MRLKQIDSNGVISILSANGITDMSVLTNGSFRVQQRVAAAATAIDEPRASRARQRRPRVALVPAAARARGLPVGGRAGLSR